MKLSIAGEGERGCRYSILIMRVRHLLGFTRHYNFKQNCGDVDEKILFFHMTEGVNELCIF